MYNDLFDFSWSHNGFELRWDLHHDKASLTPAGAIKPLWAGSLLPGLWLVDPSAQKRFVKARAVSLEEGESHDAGVIELDFDGLASGSMSYEFTGDRVNLSDLKLRWKSAPCAIISMYIGASEMGPDERRMAPNLEKPFWPDWQATGVCIPCAKTGPIQSFVRLWDLGHSRIALGNYGPSMGTPYGAAFPRPILACGMGDDNGWLVMGNLTPPDGAMCFKSASFCGCLEYHYREDLWGAIDEPVRTWSDYLQLTWSKHAIDAYHHFYYPEAALTRHSEHQISMWNTWGDFKEGIFDLKDTPRRIKQSFGVDVLVYDDPWETMSSSGDTDYEKFPDFDEAIEKTQQLGMKVGLWQSVGWLDRPEEFGLGKEDLLCGTDGEPRQCSWSFNPYSDAPRHYALDPSSENTRRFLIERTRKVLGNYPASLLKLDFYYGLPGPDVAVPRDPKYRGEQLGIELVRIIAKEARRIRPDINILCYGLHPRMGELSQMIALDDLGDSAGRESHGHGQWCVWTSIIGRGGIALNGSSGYHWAAERDVVMNSAIMGAPGGILPYFHDNGAEVPRSYFRPRRALAYWFRRTVGWKPLWLDTHLGDLIQDPTPRCWGRLENFGDGDRLTALALRKESEGYTDEAIAGIVWTGNWILVSQDDLPIRESRKLACIPIGDGCLSIASAAPTTLTGKFERDGVDVDEALSPAMEEGSLVLKSNDSTFEGGLLGYLIER
ncbi:hypothetical protein [Cerasicoccus frondis]|uniref:hypothetical protein n=1 Tax=Cerasicoccus frondis TaxID=490090 RepID=UPI002852C78A|nr:hypothetical protein [Cerasicoccus frondis]